MPADPVYSDLKADIQHLANVLAAPVFEPHMTLLSGIAGDERELVERTATLARDLAPFEIRLGTISYSSEYFRAMAIDVALTPDLHAAHGRARQRFDAAAVEYRPHLSLVYGHYPTERKRALQGVLQSVVHTQSAVGHLTLLKAESADPADWHETASFELRGARTHVTGDRS